MLLPAIAFAAESAEQTAGGLGALGVDVRGLLFQVLNFAILLLLLYRFAYRPLLTVLESRRQTIEESLKSAAQIEETRRALEEEQRTVLATARREAEVIVGKGEKAAQAIQTQAEATGKQAAQRLVTQAEAKVAQQVTSARAALKQETLGLVMAATEQILEQKLDDKQDKVLVESALAKAQAALQRSASL